MEFRAEFEISQEDADAAKLSKAVFVSPSLVGARRYDAVDALLADADVDAVYLATPPGSHVEIALQVAAAGKALYVEKPAARTATECETMAAAFEAASLPLFVAYYRRGYPRYAALRRSIQEGRLGTVERVEYACASGSLTR